MTTTSKIKMSHQEIDQMDARRKEIVAAEAAAADGTWLSVAVWDTKHRDYLELPGMYESERAACAAHFPAQLLCGARLPVGARLVRKTKHLGSITTGAGWRARP